jgi:hypothetical protein
MREFWVSSGHHLSRRDARGELVATPELVTAWLARPELAPPEEACAAERALHASLLADPLRAVGAQDVAALADADARENWGYFLRFRDLVVSAGSIERAYRRLALAERVDLPPLFLDQMAHLILRNALDDCDDPFTLRGGELFFRAQKGSVQQSALLLADQELVEEIEQRKAALMHVAPLTAMMEEDLDVMDAENAWTYWSRSDANSMAMNIGGDARARAGLSRAVEAWVGHLTGLRVEAEAIARLEDKDWRWFIGLDPEGTRIGNALWRGESLRADDLERVVAILRVNFCDDAQTRARLKDRVQERVRGKPFYLFLGCTADRVVRMKPQNLIAGLPLTSQAFAEIAS